MFSLFRKSRLSPLEHQLLEAVASKLEPAAATLFRGQLAEVNLIQRHAEAKEVNCYVKRCGSVRRNSQLQFPNQTLEPTLATVAFHAASDRKTVRAELVLVKGFFFSILFNASPQGLEMPVVVDRITLEADPMLPRSADAGTRQAVSVALTGYLAEWQHRFHIRGSDEPLPAAERDRRLAAIHARLPNDYLELIQQSEGLDIEDRSIFGLGHVRELAGGGANYYLLAEMAGVGMRGVRCDGAVAFLTYDFQIKHLPDFRSAMESYLNRPRRDKSRPAFQAR